MRQSHHFLLNLVHIDIIGKITIDQNLGHDVVSFVEFYACVEICEDLWGLEDD